MIEDVSSTNVGALVICDTARVETINSLTPLGANDFLLLELGQIYIGPGSAPAVPTNTSVFVQFTAVDGSSNPLPGLVVPVGFTVSDGTYQYIVQDGGVTDSNGVTPLLFCEASIPGSWSVATSTVTQLITAAPPGTTLTVTNPLPGTSGGPAETSEQYRARVLQAGQAISTGTATLLKTLLGQVAGVQQRLISIIQATSGWEVICGGGDPYLIAGAIYASGLNVQTLVGSTLSVTGITNANPGVVTTDKNHGYTTGQVVNIAGVVGMTPINGVPLTVTVLTPKTFSVGVNTSGYPAYVSGGVVTPNLKNVTVNIYDYPDTYGITFVNPPQQTVTMTVQYSTTAANFSSQAAVAQLAAPAIADYVNALPVGAPINLIVTRSVFLDAVASVLPPSQVSALTITVSINGISTPPSGGTQLVNGDPESFFEAVTSGITVTKS